MNINDRVEIISGEYKGIIGTINRINEDTYVIKSDKIQNRIMGYPTAKENELKLVLDESKDINILVVLKSIEKKHSKERIKLNSGDIVEVDSFIANTILKVYNAVNKSHKKRMLEMLSDNKHSFEMISDFALKQIK